MATVQEAMAELDTQVTATTDVHSSTILLLTKLSEQIAAAKNDPVKIQEIATRLKSSADALATAVEANTPSE